MTNNKCLNCGNEVSNNYCSYCGQKTDTHRLSFKHFLFHTILHGIFHIDKGMLYTAKQALARPGKASIDYISGKRVNYYNVFYFILLLLGLNILLTHYFNVIALNIDPETAVIPDTNEAGKKIAQIFSDYGKLLVFALVPITAFNSFICFKRQNLNYSEHFMISGMLLLGIFCLTTIMIVTSFLQFLGLPDIFFEYFHIIFPYLIILYIIFGYYNAFRKKYSLLGFSYRMLFFLLLSSIQILIFVYILFGIVTGWDTNVEIEYTL